MTGFHTVVLGQYKIIGTVVNTEGEPVEHANVYSTNADSTQIVSYDYTNSQGSFTLRFPKQQVYDVHVRSLGYEDVVFQISPQKSKEPQKIILQKKVENLDEITIEGQKDIVSQKDTVWFNTDSFTQGDEQVVEDILKNLPGVDVKEEGKISVNGEVIDKVLIEDDDLFGSSYSLITKNMSSDIIDGVSVYKNYEGNEALQQVSNSDETVINLELKEGAKQDLFATLDGAYDLKDHYKGKVNAVSVSEKIKAYYLGNVNNIGSDPTGNIYTLVNPDYLNHSKKLGVEAKSEKPINASTPFIPYLDNDQYEINQAMLHTIGTVFSPSEKLTVKALGYYFTDTQKFDRISVTSYDQELGLPEVREPRDTHIASDAFQTKVTANYAFNKNQNVEYKGSFSALPEKFNSRITFQDSLYQNVTKNEDQSFENQLSFYSSLSDGRAVRFRLKNKREKTEQSLFLKPTLSAEGGDFDTGSQAITQGSNSELYYWGMDGKYWQKRDHYFLAISGGLESDQTSLKVRSPELVELGGQSFWNLIRAYLKAEFEKEIGQLDLKVSLTGNQEFNEASSTINIQKEQFYLSPSVEVGYQLDDKQRAALTYKLNQKKPSLKQLFSGFWLSDYRTIDRGTETYQLTTGDEVSAFYQYGNWEDEFLAHAFIYFNKVDNVFIQDRQLSASYYNTGRYITADDFKTLNAGVTIDQFLDALRSNVKLKYNFTKNEGISVYNDFRNRIESVNQRSELSLRTAFIGSFNMQIGGAYSISTTQNLAESSVKKQDNYSGFLTVNSKLWDTINATAEAEFYSLPDSKKYTFVDCYLDYDLQGNSLKVFLEGKNLLNNTSFQTTYLSEYSQLRRVNRLNPRYILFGISYQI